MILTKSKLAVILSRLKDFDEHILQLEQYSTPSEIAADMVWRAYMKGDVTGKSVLDPACGPGFFGIGCLLLGAKKAYFVDIDEKAIDILKSNINLIKLKIKELDERVSIKNIDIKNFNQKVDTVIQNPPFGVKRKHADRVFLEKAFEISKVIYSLHKIESANFIKSIAKDSNFEITGYWDYLFQLKKTQRYHKKRIHKIKVGCWRLHKLRT